VLGAPIIRSDRWRVGFSVTRPLAWRPSGIDAAHAVRLGGESDALGYAAEADLSSYIVGAAVGYAPGGRGARVRLGAGLGLSRTSLSQSQSVTGQVVSDAGAGAATRGFTAEGSTAEALVTGGVQWDVHPRVSLGVRVVSPGLRLTGTSRLSYHESRSEQPGFTDLTFRDTGAEFAYKVPLEVDVGAALRATKGEVEVGVRYHGSVSAYDLYSSDVAGQLLRADGGSPPSVDAVPFGAARNSARSITNVAVGGHYQILSRLRVHAGFATDQSPVDEQATSLFRKVNLYRVTAGASFTGSTLSGSLGIGYSSGSGARRTTQETDDGRSVETGLQVRSINLVYAVSYAF
jgi:long-subunit fatty acid transport protein